MNWQLAVAIASVIVAIVSIAVNVLLYRRGRKYKQLSYEKLSAFSVLNVLEEYQDNVTVHYHERVEDGSFQERNVTDIYAVEIRILNTGTEPISLPGYTESGFVGSNLEEPVIFDFGNTEILSASVSATKPQGKKVTVSKATVEVNALEREVVKLEPVMLNPQDSVSVLTLLADQPDDEPKVYTTIEGATLRRRVPEAREAQQNLQGTLRLMATLLPLSVIATALVLSAFSLDESGPFDIALQIALVFLVLGCVVAALLVYVLRE